MTPERHRQIGELYHAVLAMESGKRREFIEAAAGGDVELQREVESLLVAHAAAGSFIAAPVLTLPFAQAAASLLVGRRFAHYDVVAQIGAGGMGEVYRARDAKLGRDVAIKILPRAFVDDPDRRARFNREARLLAALNHPHIGAIYGVEESDGISALVLELVDGSTLAERIAHGPIAIGEALNVAGQIADALDAAHSHGIIHRDLKPANIKITADGTVKVLDFGLAKAADTAASGTDQSRSIMGGGTSEGVILGTAAYMSPEQARAKPVDKRTDIWAFGCVLYEMLTGRAAFAGETLTDTLAAILDRDPDWAALPPATPDKVRDILRRSLQKDTQRRLRDIGDARLDIGDAQRVDASTKPATASASRRERLAWSAAAIMAMVAVAGFLWTSRRSGSMASAPEMRVEITTPSTTDPVSVAISPDGQTVVFVAPFEGRPRLWLRRLDAVSARSLPGTDLAALPFWSPDGRSLGFFANHRVKRIDLDGGRVQALARVEVGLGGTWTRGGDILFSGRTAGPIFRVAESGGEPQPVTEVHQPQFGHRFPQMLPDGRHFLYYVAGARETSGVYVAGLDGSDTRRVFPADSAAIYATSGHLLFIRQGTLYGQRFDPVTRLTSGNAFSVAERVTLESRFGRPALSAATTGPIIYRGTGTAGRNTFIWFDRTGRATGTLGERSDLDASHASLSPDTRQVAISRTVDGNTDIWLLDTSRDKILKFTSEPGSEVFPLWSPDGSRLVYGTQQAALVGSHLSEKSIAGGHAQEFFAPATAGLSNALPDDWSSDGRFILFRDISPKSGYDLWALPVQPMGKPFPLVQTDFEEGGGQFSPDGKWIAYQSDESGRSEIYVQPFPGPGARTPISTSGGTQVRWNRTGRELFYIALDGRMMAVPIRIASDGKALDAAAPSALFTTRILGGLPGQGNYRQQYMVSPDGQRFLIQSVVQEDTSPIIVILNWKAGS